MSTQRISGRLIVMSVLVIIAIFIVVLLAAGFLFSRMPARSFSGSPASPGPAERKLQQHLQDHVEFLAGRIGQRHIWRPEALAQAADYITATLDATGLPVSEQVYTVDGVDCRNITAELQGSSRAEEVIVVGAHYDTVPGTPGANDNGSGIALLLETARRFAAVRPDRTIRFVAFVNEEPPFFKTSRMGSRVYTTTLQEEKVNVVGMFSLETVGHYDRRSNSQAFPLPLLRLFYPTRGDFIAFVGDFSSQRFLRRSLAAFRRRAELPSEGIVAPAWVTGIDWSDHWSFWRAGYPAAMVTDTALYRYEHYHAAADTPDQLDYPAMTRLAKGFDLMLRELAGGNGGRDD